MGEKKYRSRFYSVIVALTPDKGSPLNEGFSNEASVTIQNFPFLMERLGHGIVGENHILNAGPITAHADVGQDGQYLIRFRTDDKNYMDNPLLGTAAFGNGQGVPPIDLPAPIELQPKTTLIVEIVNAVERKTGIKVQVVFHGVEPYEVAPFGATP